MSYDNIILSGSQLIQDRINDPPLKIKIDKDLWISPGLKMIRHHTRDFSW